MNFHQPETIAEAVALLSANEDARCLAGGATLVAMINAQLLMPATLVSLNRIRDLVGITEYEGGYRISAMTTHHQVATDARFKGGHRVVRSAAGQIAHPGVRRMGTIGGSIAHADPAADFPSALVAADSRIEITGSAGARLVAADDFFIDYYTTAVQAGELVTAVVLPAAPQGATGVHRKFARTDGDFATASVSLVLAVDGVRCSYIRIAVGGCGATPVRVEAAERLLLGSELDAGVVAAAGAMLADACDPIDDVRGSAEYRLLLVPRLLRQAIDLARFDLEVA